MKRERKPLINDTLDFIIVLFLTMFLILSFAIPVWAIFWGGRPVPDGAESLEELQAVFAQEEALRYPRPEELGADTVDWIYLSRDGEPTLPYEARWHVENEDGIVYISVSAKRKSGAALLRANETVGETKVRIIEEKEKQRSEAVPSQEEEEPFKWLDATFFVDGYRYTVHGQTETGEITEELREMVLAAAQNIIEQ